MKGKLARASILGVLVVLGVVGAQAARGDGGTVPVRWIVFSASPAGLPPAQLFRMQTDGKGLEQLTKGKYIATQPDFSPDGKRIAFARLNSGIYIMNVDGSGQRRLTRGARDVYPVWAPNGKRIAFLRVVKNQWRVFVMSPTGSGLRRLNQAPPAGRPSWTADGKWIYTPARGTLEKIDARTGRTASSLQLSQDLPIATTVSPDSRNIAFDNPRPSAPGCGEVSCVVFALYVADVKRGKIRKFINDAGPAGWSADSKTVVFVHLKNLVLAPFSGGARTSLPIVGAIANADAPPAWQPR